MNKSVTSFCRELKQLMDAFDLNSLSSESEVNKLFIGYKTGEGFVIEHCIFESSRECKICKVRDMVRFANYRRKDGK
jgi:hypothetical protein